MEQESSETTSDQDRFEMVLKIVTPALDLVLAIGEHVSKRLSPGDPDYYPVEEPEKSQRTFTG